MDLTGAPDGEPQRAGVPVADIFTGVYSAVGILAALAEREKTGRGCQVDTALVDSQVGVLANQALNFLVSGKVPKRIGNAHPNIVPYQVFPVADGHIIIATGNDNQFAKLCAVLGEPELAQEPRYLANSDRLQQSRRAGRAALRADQALLARRPAGEARGRAGAGRPDQPARPGLYRPAGGAPRHADRPCRARPPRAAASRACARRS